MKYYIERGNEKIPITLEELKDFQEKPVIHTDIKQICVICGNPMYFFGNPYDELFNTFLCLKCIREGRIKFPKRMHGAQRK